MMINAAVACAPDQRLRQSSSCVTGAPGRGRGDTHSVGGTPVSAGEEIG